MKKTIAILVFSLGLLNVRGQQNMMWHIEEDFDPTQSEVIECVIQRTEVRTGWWESSIYWQKTTILDDKKTQSEKDKALTKARKEAQDKLCEARCQCKSKKLNKRGK